MSTVAAWLFGIGAGVAAVACYLTFGWPWLVLFGEFSSLAIIFMVVAAMPSDRGTR